MNARVPGVCKAAQPLKLTIRSHRARLLRIPILLAYCVPDSPDGFGALGALVGLCDGHGTVQRHNTPHSLQIGLQALVLDCQYLRLPTVPEAPYEAPSKAQRQGH